MKGFVKGTLRSGKARGAKATQSTVRRTAFGDNRLCDLLHFLQAADQFLSEVFLRL
jgi:hypothetical protein